MSAARVPLAYRDSCANLLIPLNKCRYNEYYLPWKCEVRIDLSTLFDTRSVAENDTGEVPLGYSDLVRLHACAGR